MMSEDPTGPEATPRERHLWDRTPGLPDPSPWKGVGLAMLLHVGAAVVVLILGGVVRDSFLPMIFLGCIGATQLVYIVPAILIASFRGNHAVIKGLSIGAAVTFLLNALCVGGAMFLGSR